MKRVSTATRLSFSLVALTLSVLLAAQSLGLMPDPLRSGPELSRRSGMGQPAGLLQAPRPPGRTGLPRPSGPSAAAVHFHPRLHHLPALPAQDAALPRPLLGHSRARQGDARHP